MYNLHQYTSSVRMAQQQRIKQQNHTKFILRPRTKAEIFRYTKGEGKQFYPSSTFRMIQQNQSEKPFIFEDDHYKHWRAIKPFRDIEDSDKFVSFKTFRHKPSIEMDKYYDQRERKQIMELSQRKEHLVRSNIIPEQQRNRSLRCQGPLNPKITFRQVKQDSQYLQPHLRFQSVTDRQRFNQSSMSFDDKFKDLYKSFEMTKSKIGRTTVSKVKIDDRERDFGRDSLDILDQSNLADSKPYYLQNQISTIQPSENISIEGNKKTGRGKLHFKLAKTMHLLGDPSQRQQIQSFLHRTQYDRRKDLSNIRYNINNENHKKHPIL